jgi:outer membrane receptor protein involved in Fe transport
MNRMVVAVWLALSFPTAASAQESPVDTVVRQMEEVVVTATRSEAALAQLPYAVQVLTRRDLRRQPSRTVPEALAGLPGVFIQKTNHAGGSPFVRGLTGNQTLLVVDGIRLNNSIFRYGPNQYLTLVDPEWADRIEVVKGTGSVQYGTDAMTGVVHILTRTPSFRTDPLWKARVGGRLATSGIEQGLRPELEYSGKRVALLAGASFRRFGDLLGGDSTGFQRPSGYAERSFDAKLRADLGRGWTATASFQHLQQSGVPVYHRYVLEGFAVNTSDPIGRGFGYLRAEKSIQSPIPMRLNLFAAWQRLSEERQSRRGGSKVLRTESDRARTISWGADLFLSFSPHWTSNTGVEAYADRVSSTRVDRDLELDIPTSLRGLYPDGARYLQASAYSLHHLRFGRLSVEAGTRYSLYRARITDRTLGGVEVRPDALVFQAGADYRLGERLHIFVHASEGFRAPNIDDLGTLGIVDFRYERPAYDLRPEKSLNAEVGLRHVGTRFSAQASAFRTTLRDLITRIKTAEVVSGYDVYVKRNVDRGFIEGWELQAEGRPGKGWLVSGNATYLYGQSVTRDEPLRRIPPFTARLSVEYARDGWRAGVMHDHAGAQRRLEAGDKSDNRIPKGGTPGFNLLHAQVSRDLGRVSLRMHLVNLLNADYRTHGSGINGQGRSLLLSAVVEW